MAKQKPKGRLRYDKETDTFLIEIWNEEYQEWGLCRSQRCQKGVNQAEDEEPALLHYTMLKELAQMAEWGYDIHIARR